MPVIQYIEKKLNAQTLATIETANEIIKEYSAGGYDLTLRQLYYQFVARDLIDNKQTEYKRLGAIINDGRLCGLIDWHAIEDRTRSLRSLSHWDDPSDIISSAASSYRIDKWAGQPCRIEVWIEKDALIGVIERVCNANDIPFFSCRGYTSQSEMWRASQRIIGYNKGDQTCMVIHLGDHDPSGIDMTRDIEDRLRLFGADVSIDRIALNMDQVEEHNPPPNPAKLSDSRAAEYIMLHGSSSWELDALDPATLGGLISDKIAGWRDEDAWQVSTDHEDRDIEDLDLLSDNYGTAVSLLRDT